MSVVFISLEKLDRGRPSSPAALDFFPPVLARVCRISSLLKVRTASPRVLLAKGGCESRHKGRWSLVIRSFRFLPLEVRVLAQDRIPLFRKQFWERVEGGLGQREVGHSLVLLVQNPLPPLTRAPKRPIFMHRSSGLSGEPVGSHVQGGWLSRFWFRCVRRDSC